MVWRNGKRTPVLVRTSWVMTPSERPSKAHSFRRSLWMLGVTGAVLTLLLVSFGVHHVLDFPRGLEDAGVGDGENFDERRAELLERVAAKRAELDRMVGRSVAIAGGTFWMGDDEGNFNERPRQAVRVGAFEIDETEVSVAAYQLCVAADRCTAPGSGSQCNWGQPNRRGHPVNCVDWDQAVAFCRWAAKRLPTEQEWEYAARGPAGLRYPWGEVAPTNQLCWGRGLADGGTEEGTCPALGMPGGESMLGVKGMADNVREWTSTKMCPYARPDCESTTMVMRGGAWTDTDPLGVRLALRNAKEPSYRSDSVGFRCARDDLKGQ